MRTLPQLKDDMAFIRQSTWLVDVLKKIALSQFYFLEHQRRLYEPLVAHVEAMLQGMDIRGVAHPLLQSQAAAQGLVVITSDEGFLGGLNMQVTQYALQQRHGAADRLLVVGERGGYHLRDSGQPYAALPGLDDTIAPAAVERLRDAVYQWVLSGQVGSVAVVYPHFVSLAHQEVRILPLLPCAWLWGRPPAAAARYVEYESSPGAIVEQLVRAWLSQQLYDVCRLSKLSELAARSMYMESRYHELKEQEKRVTFQYFRRLHEQTDKGIREVCASHVMAGAEEDGSHD